MLVVLGLVAGLVTTVAGMGGGMLLTLALAAWWGDPVAAIAVSTPALLVGNAHRLLLFREYVAWRALPFVGAGLLGAAAGGWLAVAVPAVVVQLGMASAAALAVARHAGWVRVRIGGAALAPAGLGIGVASTAGGAGMLAGPVLLSAGLSGAAYLATMSLSSLSMHVGRLVAFGASGVVVREQLATAAVLAVCITAGNAAGRRIRERAGERAIGHVEVGTAAGLVVLAVAGLARTMV